MLPFKNLLFDLDGTLIDSSDGIIRSAQYAFEKLGKEVPPYKTMFKFVGPPLDDTFRNDYGFTPEESIQAVLFYRERYHIDGVKEAAPYEGIDELLTDLRQAGYDLYVATSKPEKLSQRFLEIHGLAHHFTEICGSLEFSRKNKDEVIEYLLPKLQSGGEKSALMIGDRKFDVIGAAAFGIPCVGVKYGFAEEGEFEKAGAKYIVDTVNDLRELLLG